MSQKKKKNYLSLRIFNGGLVLLMSFINSGEVIDKYIQEDTDFIAKNNFYDNKHKTWFPTGTFQQKKFYEIPGESFMLYCLLRSNIIRGNMLSDFYKEIKKIYYDNGYLVCALTQQQMAKKTGWHRSKVRRHLLKLVDVRCIRIDKMPVNKQLKRHIYLLGRTSNIGEDRYYIDEFINTK